MPEAAEPGRGRVQLGLPAACCSISGQAPPRGAGHLPHARHPHGRGPRVLRHRQRRAGRPVRRLLRAGRRRRGNSASRTASRRTRRRWLPDPPRPRPRPRSRPWSATTTSSPSRRPARTAPSPTTDRPSCAGPPRNWRAYLKSEPEKPDASLAQRGASDLRSNGSEQAQGRPGGGPADRRGPANNTNAYLKLVQYAALAGDTRTADLAAQKAVDLAPKGERRP